MAQIDKPRVLIAGCGDLGTRLGQVLAAMGWQVYGLRRHITLLPEAIVGVAGDLQAEPCPADWPEGPLDYLVYSAAPKRGSMVTYEQLYLHGWLRVQDWLTAHGQRPRRQLFISSTGVYGQHHGEWVDECSPTIPQTETGRWLLAAEQAVQNSPHPSTCVRLAGLYGPGRDGLLRRVWQGEWPPAEPVCYGNRIHVADACSLLQTLLLADYRGLALEECYLGVDDCPAAHHDVALWLAAQLGATRSPEPSGLPRVGSKRCCNQRARRLGWQPSYPDYQRGYAPLCKAFNPPS